METPLFRQCIEPENNKINLLNPTRWKRMEMDEMSMSEKNGEEEEEEEQENNSDPDEDGISNNEQEDRTKKRKKTDLVDSWASLKEKTKVAELLQAI